MDYSKFQNPYVQKLSQSIKNNTFSSPIGANGVISLAVGEPEYCEISECFGIKTPYFFFKSVGYTQSAGDLDLRKAIAKYTSVVSQAEYNPQSEIIVTVGASEAIDLTLRAIVSPEDEVIVPEPCFSAYVPLVRINSGIPIKIPCKVEKDFLPTTEQIEKAVSPRTKAIILSYPNNPTGAVMTKEMLMQIANIANKHDIVVIADEIYAQILYDDAKFYSIASLDGMKERTILIGGFSKIFGMTGFRIGYVCAPKFIAESINFIHANSVMCAPSISQSVALDIINQCIATNFEGQKRMLEKYANRRKLICDALNDAKLACTAPKSTFYAFANVSKHGIDGEEFAKRLLSQQKVLVTPGTTFGEHTKDYIRVSFSCNDSILKDAIKRITKFAKQYQNMS